MKFPIMDGHTVTLPSSRLKYEGRYTEKRQCDICPCRRYAPMYAYPNNTKQGEAMAFVARNR